MKRVNSFFFFTGNYFFKLKNIFLPKECFNSL